MALELGGVFTRVGFKFDDDDANRYERKIRDLRGDARKDITTDAKLDVDEHSMQKYKRGIDDADRSNRNFVRGSGRLRTSLGSLFLGGAGVAAAGAAFVGLGAGVKKAWGEFEEAAKVGAQTNAVIKSTGGAANVTADEVSALSTALSNKTAIDDEAIQSGANMLLTFTNLRNEAGKGNDVFNQATTTLTDMSAALGVDAKTQAIQLGKALNDPIKGISALSRVGVTFTDQQKEQITTLVESGKTMEAQKIILRELNKEFGGSAEAQARPLDRAKVAVDNLFEAIGTGLAPTIEGAATILADFVTGIQTGEGAGGDFVDVLEKIVAAGRAAGHWIGVAAENVRHFLETGDAGGGVIGAALNFLWSTARRVIPGVMTQVRGLVSIVRGTFDVIAGILTLDFGRAWNGAKRIVSGAVKVIGGVVRTITAPFREMVSRVGAAIGRFASMLFREGRDAARGFVTRIVNIVRDLPGDYARLLRSVISRVVSFAGNLLREGRDAARGFVRGVVNIVSDLPGTLGRLAGRAASAVGDRLVNGLQSIPGRIKGIFTGVGGIIGDIGRGIADWLNANTPLGNRISLPGPLPDFTLPALRRGGRVGPGTGGPEIYVVGEGGMDEWVISQEGDRQRNIGYAIEALRALGVPMHAKGIDPGKASKKVAAGEGGVAKAARKVDSLERAYTRLERGYARTDEELIGEDPDGNAIVNETGVKVRLAEIADLEAKQTEIITWYTRWRNRVIRLQKTLTSMVKRLEKTLGGLKGKKNRNRREQIGRQIQGYRQRLDELKDQPYEIGQTILDENVDLADLQWEYATVGNTTVPPSPGGGAGGGDSGAAPASQEDVAREALAQFAAFQGARADLFGSQGANFAAAGTSAFEGALGLAAGSRFFGAGAGAAGSGGGRTINQTFNFAEGPGDELTFSQRVNSEMQAALR